MDDGLKVHYSSPGLLQRTFQGLDAIGKSTATVDLDDLAGLPEFHLRGPRATREFIETLNVGLE